MEGIGNTNGSAANKMTGRTRSQNIAPTSDTLKGRNGISPKLSHDSPKKDISNLMNTVNSLRATISSLQRDQTVFYITINDKLSELEERLLNNLNDKIISLVEKSLASTTQNLLEFNNKLKQFEEKLNNDSVKNDIDAKLVILDDKIDTLERSERKNKLIISNIPVQSDTSDLDLFNNIAEVIEMEEIELGVVKTIRLKSSIPSFMAIFRDGNAKEWFLTSYFKKKSLFHCDINISNLQERIYVNEHLTKRNGN